MKLNASAQEINTNELDNKIINEAIETIDIEIESLERIKSKIGNSFIQAVNLISNSEKVILTGVGKSGIIANKIAATLSSIGIPSFFLHPVEALHGDIGLVGMNDTAILLSKSGSTEEIVRLMPYLKSRSARIISIVGNTNSYLSRMSDIILDASVEREACPLNLAPTASTTAALALGDALAVCCMKLRNMTLSDFAFLHPSGQIGRNTSVQVKDVMHKSKQLPLIHESVTFREAIIEISTKSLGCVCIVNPKNRLTGIITDGDIRRVLQKYDDIRELKIIDIMTKNPVTVSPDSFLGEALSLMENRLSQISVLPVVDEKMQCLGVIRLHDILQGIS